MPQLNDLFTLSSLLSLQGAVAAALLLPNAIGLIVTVPPKVRLILSLVVALLLAGLVAALAEKQDVTKWVVAFFNGLLIFTSAAGINQGAAGANPRPGLGARGAGKPQFFEKWF